MILKKSFYFFLICFGIVYQKIFSKTPRVCYVAFRRYFILNSPHGFEFFNKLFKKIRPLGNIQIEKHEGIISLNSSKIEHIVKEIESNGYYIFEEKIEKEVIESINNKLGNVQFNHFGNKINFDETDSIDYPRFDYDNQQLIDNSPELVDLIFDKSLYTIAANYLQTKPYMDLIACWYSKPSENGKSEAAQEYHYDLDRFKFIKFFVYLNDVHSSNGPHCYIQTSNKLKPNNIQDRRYSDTELLQKYSKDQFKEIIGSAGTIIAVDTIGYHKGKELTKGDRTIFQIEYANSMFGQNYPKVKLTSKNHLITKPFAKVFY